MQQSASPRRGIDHIQWLAVSRRKGDTKMTPITDDSLTTNALAGFHLLAKPSGSTCNIDCTYCFFLSKESLYPNEKNRMSDVTLETYIRQLLEAHQTPTVTVAWQGGEPTLFKLWLFTRSASLCAKYARAAPAPQPPPLTNRPHPTAHSVPLPK